MLHIKMIILQFLKGGKINKLHQSKNRLLCRRWTVILQRLKIFIPTINEKMHLNYPQLFLLALRTDYKIIRKFSPQYIITYPKVIL
jgi:hypothetical protein